MGIFAPGDPRLQAGGLLSSESKSVKSLERLGTGRSREAKYKTLLGEERGGEERREEERRRGEERRGEKERREEEEREGRRGGEKGKRREKLQIHA